MQSTPSAPGSPRFEICRAPNADLTIFCPFTRKWAVKRFFIALAASDVPLADATFIGYVDSDDKELLALVKREAMTLPFAGVILQFSDWAPPAEQGNSAGRRIRHALMREASKALVTTGPLLLLEDDTLIPPKTFARLSAARKKFDWVIGVEVGRWGANRPIGVWHMTEKDGKPYQLDSVMPPPQKNIRTESADATGLYCVLTDSKTYHAMDFGTWNNAIGHDVYATWQLMKAGTTLGIHWGVPCIHLTETGEITVDDAHPYTRELHKYDTETLVRVTDLPAQAVKPPAAVVPLTYPVRLAIQVTFQGKIYPAGTMIDRDTALAMKNDGLLSSPRIV